MLREAVDIIAGSFVFNVLSCQIVFVLLLVGCCEIQTVQLLDTSFIFG